MSDIDIADRANEEIKALLRRLDPDRTVHKDRVRRLQKFKNFVVGENVSFFLRKKENEIYSPSCFVCLYHVHLLSYLFLCVCVCLTTSHNRANNQSFTMTIYPFCCWEVPPHLTCWEKIQTFCPKM